MTTISLVGDAGVTWPGSGTTTQVFTYSSTAGNTLILSLGFDNPSTPPSALSITDTASNTWHYSTSTNASPPYGEFGGGGLFNGTFVAWCINAAAVTSVTVTMTNGDQWQGVLSEWSGIASMETTAVLVNSEATGTLASPSVTPANAADLIICHAQAPGPVSATGGTGFGPDNNNTLYSLPGSTAPYQFTWTTAATGFTCAVAVFSPGVVAPASPTVNVATYGAKGDGKVVYDGAMSSSVNPTHLACATSTPFSASDVGKTVMVATAGGSGQPLVTTISSFTDSGHVVLAAGASATVSGTGVVFGTDDTAAINNAVTAATAYAQAHGNYAMITGAPVTYMLAGALTQQTISGFHWNSQIPLPWVTTSEPKLSLEFNFGGEGSGVAPVMFGSTVPQLPSGAVFCCTLTGQANSGTYGAPSVIGGPTDAGNSNTGSNWDNIMPVIKGLTIMVPLNPTVTGLDFRGCSCASVVSYSYLPFDTHSNISATAPSHNWTGGLYMPIELNNDNSFIGQVNVYGCYYGTAVYSHVSAQTIKSVLCYYGVFVGGAGSDNHSLNIGHMEVAACNTALQCDGTSPSRISIPVTIAQLDVESVNWFGSSGVHVDDPNNGLGGVIYINDNTASTFTPPGSVITVTGGANVEIIAACQPRGNATAPSVPSSGTAKLNPFWRHAMVVVTGGVVTGISVDGVSTGLTSGMVIVPAGKTITLTYTSAPTWKWWLS